jgi:hypothetical protein
MTDISSAYGAPCIEVPTDVAKPWRHHATRGGERREKSLLHFPLYVPWLSTLPCPGAGEGRDSRWG